MSRAARDQPQPLREECAWNKSPASRRSCVLRLVSATQPRAGCAGTPPRPRWFFLDKIFGGRKVKWVNCKSLHVPEKTAEGKINKLAKMMQNCSNLHV